MANPLVAGAIQRAFDAREKASSAQEAALGALMLPSAADIERLTRRVRSVSQRLEGIEDGIDRLDERVAGDARRRPASTRAWRRSRTSSPRSRRSCTGLHRGAADGGEARLAAPGAPEGLGLAAAARRGRDAPSAPAPTRPSRSAARSSASASIRRALAVGVEDVGDRQQAGDADPAQLADAQQRRGLHLDRQRAGRAPRARARRRRGRRRGRSWRSARCARARRRAPSPAAACSAATSPASAATSPSAPSARLAPSPASAASAMTRSPSARSPSSAPHVPTRIARCEAEVAELLEHDRRARPAHPGALDRQRLAVGGAPRVAPQAAVVVEHLRLGEHELGERERAARVAGQQRARGQRGGGVDVDGHRGAAI